MFTPSQLSHKGKVLPKKSTKNPQPLALFCLAYPMATLVFAFVNGSSQTIACGPLRYSCCIAALQNLLQSNSAGRKIKGRMGWRRGVGGWEKGGRTRGRVVFSLHHIPTHRWSGSDSFQTVKKYSSQTFVQPKDNVQQHWLRHENSAADGSLMYEASRTALVM